MSKNEIDESIIESSGLKKLPGIKIDSKLIVLMVMFKIYAKKLTKNYDQQFEQPLICILKKTDVNEFLFSEAKFDYCSLIRILHSR